MTEIKRRISSQAILQNSPKAILAKKSGEIYTENLQNMNFTVSDIIFFTLYTLATYFVEESYVIKIAGIILQLLFKICLPGIFFCIPKYFSFGEGSLVLQCGLLFIINTFQNYCHNESMVLFNILKCFIAFCLLLYIMTLSKNLFWIRRIPNLLNYLYSVIFTIWSGKFLPDKITIKDLEILKILVMKNIFMILILVLLCFVIYAKPFQRFHHSMSQRSKM